MALLRLQGLGEDLAGGLVATGHALEFLPARQDVLEFAFGVQQEAVDAGGHVLGFCTGQQCFDAKRDFGFGIVRNRVQHGRQGLPADLGQFALGDLAVAEDATAELGHEGLGFRANLRRHFQRLGIGIGLLVRHELVGFFRFLLTGFRGRFPNHHLPLCVGHRGTERQRGQTSQRKATHEMTLSIHCVRHGPSYNTTIHLWNKLC